MRWRRKAHQSQHDGLHHAHQIVLARSGLHRLEQGIAHNAAHHGAHGQQAAGPQLHQMGLPLTEDGNDGHGQHRQAGQEADGADAHDVHGVQHRLDDDAAADAADAADDGGRQTDDKNENAHGKDLFSDRMVI